MTCEVPARARELAVRLSALFRSDRQLAERLNDAHDRLRHANDELWSGLHPDALGLVYDDAGAVGRGASAIAARLIAALRDGGQRNVETAVLEGLQQAHWRIHRAFHDYQSACEERRQLAVDVGELTKPRSAARWRRQRCRRYGFGTTTSGPVETTSGRRTREIRLARCHQPPRHALSLI